jgi:hypothetical protein
MVSMWKTVNQVKKWPVNKVVNGEVPSYLRGGFNCLIDTHACSTDGRPHILVEKLSREIKDIN